MYSNEPTTNKIDSYMDQENQNQMSDDKRNEIQDSQLGRSKLSPDLEEEYRIAKARAKGKDQSVFICEWCQSQPVTVKSSREVVHLCPACCGGRSVIELYMKQNRLGHLTDSDRVSIAKKKVTRLGGGFRPKYD